MAALNTNEEKALLRQVAGGNETAFRQLLFQYADLLGSFVFRISRSRELAEEIVQDVFLKIWMSREALVEVESFRAYLFVVSRNQTLNALRKMAREKEKQMQWEKTFASLQMQAVAEEPYEYPEGLIERAIHQLPQQQRRAWLLSRQERLTHPQIAKTMALSRETVKKYIMLANQSITAYIKEHFHQ